jgi:hypothetical protein
MNAVKCTIEDFVDPEPPFFTTAKVIGENVSFEEYGKQTEKRGDPGYVMSRGALVEFDLCPARWRNGFEDSGTKATEWGQLMDCRVLEPHKYRNRYKVRPATIEEDGETLKWNGNRRSCKAWVELAEQSGFIVIGEFEDKNSATAAAELLKDFEIARMVLHSRSQVMVVGEYRDAATGITVKVKGLKDLVPHTGSGFEDSLADFKTCRDAHPRSWQKAVFEHDYHTQAALYLDLWNAATGEARDSFRHILQESFPPYQPAKRLLSPHFISMGREKYRRILKRYCECLSTGQWPDYDTDTKAEVVVDGWKVSEPCDWMLTI